MSRFMYVELVHIFFRFIFFIDMLYLFILFLTHVSVLSCGGLPSYANAQTNTTDTVYLTIMSITCNSGITKQDDKIN